MSITMMSLLWIPLAWALVPDGGAPVAPPSLIERLLRFAGISKTSLGVRGEAPTEGQIWVWDRALGKSRPLTDDGNYRSPVFLDKRTILALKGEAIMRIDATNGSSTTLQTKRRIIKLVGVDWHDSATVLVLREDPNVRNVPALLSATNGEVKDITSDPIAAKGVIEELLGQTRVYQAEDMQVEVKRQTKTASYGRKVTWDDVFLVDRKTKGDRNVSACDPASCGSPSLAPGGQLVVYLRAGPTRPLKR